MSGRSIFAGWLSSPPPSVAVEIGARRVTAVALGTAGGRPVVTAHATERLPDGAVAPSIATPNLPGRENVTAALRRVLEALGGRVRRVALVVPDGAAKVSLVKFDKRPDRASDLDQLVRWQVKKTVPFPLDQAQLSWTTSGRDEAGIELVVTVARRDIVAEYEGACAAVGVHAGLVDLATFSLANTVLAAAETPTAAADAQEDWLLAHVAPDSSTLAVLRGGALILFRNRPADGEGGLEDLVHQTAMYYEDRLGGRGLARAFITAVDLNPALANEVGALCRAFEARRGVRVVPVDVTAVAALSGGESAAPDLRQALAAPVGVLLRERRV